MSRSSYVLFGTPVGECGIAWHATAITGLQLPCAEEATAHRRLMARFGATLAERPSAHAQQAIDAIHELMQGRPNDLLSIELEMTGVPAFHQRVYAVARRIPPGRTITYGEVGARLGGRGLSRAVGQALGRNPFPIIVPCHRVVAASGALGGFSAHGGATLKRHLLDLEGGSAQPPSLAHAPSLPFADH